MLAIEKELIRRKKMETFRSLKQGKKGVDFSSNDYIGMARSHAMAMSVKKEWEKRKEPASLLGSTGSRLLTGNSSEVEALEEKVAAFHGYETATLFSSGYMANVGLISSVTSKEDTLLFDARIHASMRDGIKLSPARAFPFRHQDLNHLEERLKQAKGRGSSFILVESIYSTDGSLTSLEEVVKLGEKYGAHLIVDEAHAVGVFGLLGKGALHEKGLCGKVFAQVVTCGKALGCAGAFVLGSLALKEVLINRAHPFIYTTALPFYSLAAIKCSYDLFPTLCRERERVKRWIAMCRAKNLSPSQTPIQPILIKGSDRAKRGALFLAEHGFDVRPLVSPTVRRGEEIVRICLHAFNTYEEVERLIDLVNQCKERGSWKRLL